MSTALAESVTKLSRLDIARRAAAMIPDGSYVNLGIGIPTLAANVMPAGREIVLHSENGILGVGPAPAEKDRDRDLINASKEYVTLLPGGAYFVHSDAFVMIRGGHLDLALLGAFEVAANGDLANWTTADRRFPPGVGGAMDLAAGAKAIWVLTDHVTKKGEPKIVNACRLPLTAKGVVKRIFTDLALIDVEPRGLVVREMAPGLTLEALQAVTEPALILAQDWREMVVPAT
ncbi:MAG: 3-oxoacid CoA-transferase subunit B [Alphaproteobacteria bacterium]|nr:3-oxoacid CoA-transferase subunit B [Alphaproteobacteria bacterium]